MPSFLLPAAAIIMLVLAAVMALNGETALASALVAIGFMLIAVGLLTRTRTRHD